jgi:LPS sulfotransferase NodH
METWSRGLGSFQAARAKYDPAQFVDVQFDELRADPFAAVGRVYDALGTPLSEEGRAAMVALDADSKSGDRKPQHKYSLADYGLTAEQVAAAFA